jgi:5-deoxy-D-glucuronate isomerase
MQEIPFTQVKIIDPFWSPRLEMNASHALLHQWEQLEASGCIQNFRLVAEILPHPDSDAAGFLLILMPTNGWKLLSVATRKYQIHNYSI